MCVLLAVPLMALAIRPPVSYPETGPPPPHLFIVPGGQPETTITAERLEMSDGVATLIGRVQAVRAEDRLTAGRVLLGQDPTWILASHSPRLFRRESLPQSQATRESTLDASNIRWNSTTGELDASDSVVLKVEERTWDLGTHTWVIITADHLVGHRERDMLTFHGNVRIRDRERFGQGRQLDYFQASSAVVLSGDARVETEEWNEKNRRMEKRIIDGQRIEYRTDTRAVRSE